MTRVLIKKLVFQVVRRVRRGPCLHIIFPNCQAGHRFRFRQRLPLDQRPTISFHLAFPLGDRSEAPLTCPSLPLRWISTGMEHREHNNYWFFDSKVDRVGETSDQGTPDA